MIDQCPICSERLFWDGTYVFCNSSGVINSNATNVSHFIWIPSDNYSKNIFLYLTNYYFVYCWFDTVSKNLTIRTHDEVFSILHFPCQSVNEIINKMKEIEKIMSFL